MWKEKGKIDTSKKTIVICSMGGKNNFINKIKILL